MRIPILKRVLLSVGRFGIWAALGVGACLAWAESSREGEEALTLSPKAHHPTPSKSFSPKTPDERLEGFILAMSALDRRDHLSEALKRYTKAAALKQHSEALARNYLMHKTEAEPALDYFELLGQFLTNTEDEWWRPMAENLYAKTQDKEIKASLSAIFRIKKEPVGAPEAEGSALLAYENERLNARKSKTLTHEKRLKILGDSLKAALKGRQDHEALILAKMQDDEKPQDPGTLRLLAELHHQEGNYAASSEALKRLLDLEYSEDRLVRYVNELYLSGDGPALEVALREGRLRYPQNEQLQALSLEEMMKNKDYGAALLLLKSSSTRTIDWRCEYDLAIAKSAMDDLYFSTASQSLSHCASLGFKGDALDRTLGDYQMMTLHYAQAALHYQAAFRKNQTKENRKSFVLSLRMGLIETLQSGAPNSDWMKNLAQYLLLGADSGQEALFTLIQKRIDTPKLRAEVARIYTKAGQSPKLPLEDEEKASADRLLWLQEALELQENKETRLALAQALEASGQSKEAFLQKLEAFSALSQEERAHLLVSSVPLLSSLSPKDIEDALALSVLQSLPASAPKETKEAWASWIYNKATLSENLDLALSSGGLWLALSPQQPQLRRELSALKSQKARNAKKAGRSDEALGLFLEAQKLAPLEPRDHPLWLSALLENKAPKAQVLEGIRLLEQDPLPLPSSAMDAASWMELFSDLRRQGFTIESKKLEALLQDQGALVDEKRAQTLALEAFRKGDCESVLLYEGMILRSKTPPQEELIQNMLQCNLESHRYEEAFDDLRRLSKPTAADSALIWPLVVRRLDVGAEVDSVLSEGDRLGLPVSFYKQHLQELSLESRLNLLLALTRRIQDADLLALLSGTQEALILSRSAKDPRGAFNALKQAEQSGPLSGKLLLAGIKLSIPLGEDQSGLTWANALLSRRGSPDLSAPAILLLAKDAQKAGKDALSLSLILLSAKVEPSEAALVSAAEWYWRHEDPASAREFWKKIVAGRGPRAAEFQKRLDETGFIELSEHLEKDPQRKLSFLQSTQVSSEYGSSTPYKMYLKSVYKEAQELGIEDLPPLEGLLLSAENRYRNAHGLAPQGATLNLRKPQAPVDVFEVERLLNQARAHLSEKNFRQGLYELQKSHRLTAQLSDSGLALTVEELLYRAYLSYSHELSEEGDREGAVVMAHQADNIKPNQAEVENWLSALYSKSDAVTTRPVKP